MHKLSIERIVAWRHFYGNHNCIFPVTFIPDVVHTAIVRCFALVFPTIHIDIILIFNQFLISNSTVQCFIGKFL